MRACAILGLLAFVAVAVGQATPEQAPLPAQAERAWNKPLEELVPPTQELREVLPKLKEMREELRRAAELEKVLAYLESVASEEENMTADQVYEKLGLFRFPTVDEVSLAIDKVERPQDILDQELFEAFGRDASLGEVLSDPRVVQRFLESKQVKNGTIRLNRRLARRFERSRLRDTFTLGNVAEGLGLDERATTMDLMEAALEVIQGSRDVALRVRLGDVPVVIRFRGSGEKRTEEAPEVDVIEGKPVDLDALLESPDEE